MVGQTDMWADMTTSAQDAEDFPLAIRNAYAVRPTE
jgi:hypothetical protein